MSRTHKDVTFSAHWKKAAKNHMTDCSHLPGCREGTLPFVFNLVIPASSRAQIEALEEIVANNDAYSIVKTEKFGYFHAKKRGPYRSFVIYEGDELHEFDEFVGAVKNAPPKQPSPFGTAVGMHTKKFSRDLFAVFVVTRVATFERHSFDCAVYGGNASLPDRSKRDRCRCCNNHKPRRDNARFAARELRGDFD